MNTNDPHSPDLTAYALGELDHANDRAVQDLLAEQPELRAEMDAMADFAHILQASAPVATVSLRPEQRQAILSGPERVREMVASATKARQRQRQPMLLPILSKVLRYSAAAAVVVVAFTLGQRSAPGVVTSAPAPVPQKPSPAPTPARPAPQMVKVEPKPTLPQPEAPKSNLPAPIVPVTLPKPPDAPVVADVGKAPAANAESQVVTVAEVKPAPAAEAPSSKLTVALVNAFNTNQSPDNSFVLKPASTRPKVQVDSTTLSAPQVGQPKTLDVPQDRRVPALVIHSWRTEVFSCPWDKEKRLVRVALQIPGTQAASSADYSYDFKVNFPATQVRSYRPLAQRAVMAADKDSAAWHSAWYEVVLNGSGNSDQPRAIGAVALPNSKFTTEALAPFGSSKLQIVDRGATWESVADDSLFESAVVGLGLLLESPSKPAGLTLDQIIALADKATKAGDRNGERARFLKLVRDMKKAAGV
jgi:hypothetical protein